MSPIVRWLADEDFDNRIARGVVQRIPSVDMVRVQDIGLSGARDEAVLEWAAIHDRVVLTHDVRTMLPCAWDRVAKGLHMPGVFAVPQSSLIRPVIDAIVLIDQCSLRAEWEGQTPYLPFQ